MPKQLLQKEHTINHVGDFFTIAPIACQNFKPRVVWSGDSAGVLGFQC